MGAWRSGVDLSAQRSIGLAVAWACSGGASLAVALRRGTGLARRSRGAGDLDAGLFTAQEGMCGDHVINWQWAACGSWS